MSRRFIADYISARDRMRASTGARTHLKCSKGLYPRTAARCSAASLRHGPARWTKIAARLPGPWAPAPSAGRCMGEAAGVRSRAAFVCSSALGTALGPLLSPVSQALPPPARAAFVCSSALGTALGPLLSTVFKRFPRLRAQRSCAAARWAPRWGRCCLLFLKRFPRLRAQRSCAAARWAPRWGRCCPRCSSASPACARSVRVQQRAGHRAGAAAVHGVQALPPPARAAFVCSSALGTALGPLLSTVFKRFPRLRAQRSCAAARWAPRWGRCCLLFLKRFPRLRAQRSCAAARWAPRWGRCCPRCSSASPACARSVRVQQRAGHRAGAAAVSCFSSASPACARSVRVQQRAGHRAGAAAVHGVQALPPPARAAFVCSSALGTALGPLLSTVFKRFPRLRAQRSCAAARWAPRWGRCCLLFLKRFPRLRAQRSCAAARWAPRWGRCCPRCSSASPACARSVRVQQRAGHRAGAAAVSCFSSASPACARSVRVQQRAGHRAGAAAVHGVQALPPPARAAFVCSSALGTALGPLLSTVFKRFPRLRAQRSCAAARWAPRWGRCCLLFLKRFPRLRAQRSCAAARWAPRWGRCCLLCSSASPACARARSPWTRPPWAAGPWPPRGSPSSPPGSRCSRSRRCAPPCKSMDACKGVGRVPCLQYQTITGALRIRHVPLTCEGELFDCHMAATKGLQALSPGGSSRRLPGVVSVHGALLLIPSLLPQVSKGGAQRARRGGRQPCGRRRARAPARERRRWRWRGPERGRGGREGGPEGGEEDEGGEAEGVLRRVHAGHAGRHPLPVGAEADAAGLPGRPQHLHGPALRRAPTARALLLRVVSSWHERVKETL